MDLECLICYSSFQIEQNQLLSCGCFSCFSCLSQWTVTKINEVKADYNSSIPCPNCSKSTKIKEIMTKLPLDYSKAINEALFEVYLIQESDIRKCPNSKCSYAGVIQTTPCRKDTECPSCLTTWKEVQNHTTFDRIIAAFNLNSAINEFSSDMQKRLLTKKCPCCETKIEKNGGCDHMTCTYCQYEFCWICSSQYPNHNKIIHFFNQVIRPYLPILMKFLMIITIIYLLYLIPPIEFIADLTVIPAFYFGKSILGQVWNVFSVIIPFLWSYIGPFVIFNLGTYCAVRIILGKLMSFKEKWRYGKIVLVCIGLGYYFNFGWFTLGIGLAELVLFGIFHLF